MPIQRNFKIKNLIIDKILENDRMCQNKLKTILKNEKFENLDL